MKAEEAAQLIRAMADSVTNDRSQFNIEVKVIGTMGIGGPGGPGVSGMAIGGAPGSSATGYSSSASAGNVEVGRGEAAAQEALEDAARALRDVAHLVESGADKGTLRDGLQRLNEIAVMPGLAINATGLALKLSELIP